MSKKKNRKQTKLVEYKLNIYNHYAILEQENEDLRYKISQYEATIVDLAKQVALLNKILDQGNREYRMSDEVFRSRVEKVKEGFSHD